MKPLPYKALVFGLLLIFSNTHVSSEPCFGTMILHENCDDLNLPPATESIYLVCWLTATDPNGQHECTATVHKGGTETHTCSIDANSSCTQTGGYDCEHYQECAESSTETGIRVKFFQDYATAATGIATPYCIPDFDEDIGNGWFTHHDCYANCGDWVFTEQGSQVEIPGCADDGDDGCDPIPIEI